MKYGDITRQLQSNFQPTPKVVVASRDMTFPAGTQAITGIGFKPSFVLALSAEAVNGDTFSVGFIDSTNNINRGISQGEDGNTAGENELISARQSTPTGDYTGRITSFDTDGFTITWAKSGSPIGNLSLRFAVFK